MGTPPASGVDKEKIARHLEARFNVSMSVGDILFAEEYKPWLADARGAIDFYYWNRYKSYLDSNVALPHLVVQSMDAISDKILDHLENPCKDGSWSRRGMVIGHVQSGKTANYTGLICKAADSGYKVIIVLAGMLNSLRDQTQERIDSGFIGRDSSMLMKSGNSASKVRVIGVGEIDATRSPAALTTTSSDFSIKTAVASNIALNALKEPLIFVIKKNTKSIGNLAEWLQSNNKQLQDYPMLLIDDEADHASINTSPDPSISTAINAGIRKLLGLFSRSSYVGYTATPFANIFVDPDADDEIFPRDFILTLDPPSNYVGPDEIFGDEGRLRSCLIPIDDFDATLPLKHKKDHELRELPGSLMEAVLVFILVRALRLLDGEIRAHNSMLVNTSRFTRVQTNTKLLLLEYLNRVRDAITINCMLDVETARKNEVISRILDVFETNYQYTNYTAIDVLRRLKESADPISVIEVNMSGNAEKLDYSRKNYPNGRSVIAVGGLALSRGLTLEGLTVSYFLRNSVMYDTLMQMGRWFGYREGYDTYCRIYMPSESISWYSHIAEVLNELRSDVRKMVFSGGTPREFGLRIRSHPESLIITARNKMRTGTKVMHQVDLACSLTETTSLLTDERSQANNLEALVSLVEAIQVQHIPETENGSFLWRRVDYELVVKFLNSFQNDVRSLRSDPQPVAEYVEWLSKFQPIWDVVLIGLSEKAKSKDFDFESRLPSIVPERRNVNVENARVQFRKHRVASRGHEKFGLTKSQIEQAQAGQEKVTNIADHEYRAVRSAPLLMLHLVDCQSNDKSLFARPLVAWGISFPTLPGGVERKVVQYVVNTVWWRNEFAETLEEDDSDFDD
jgi:hypothetical protein